MSRSLQERLASAWIGTVLVSSSLLAGCGGSGASSSVSPSSTVVDTSTPAAVAEAKAQDTPVDPTLVTADNAFGLSLLQTLIQENPNTNIAISPTSAAMALQIVYNGAAGTTQTAMAQTLQLGGMGVSQLNDDNAALLASLLNPDPKVTLTVANSLWLDLSSSPVSSTFESTDQTYYGAQIGSLAGAPADVNAWGNAQTNGLIPQILPPDINLGDVIAILANVVYFKGTWEYAFDPSQTKTAPFTLADGSQTSVNMMSQTNVTLSVMSGTNFSAVALPYGQGRLSMLLALPNAGVDFDTFMSTLTAADIQGWAGQMVSTSSVDLSLPRFTTSFGQSLVAPLTTLGMGVAFERGAADLSGMASGSFISFVRHDTKVEVDETGTAAAGSTVIGIGIGAIAEPFTVEFNHPFFYAIRDNQTGTLLFTGVMMNPNAG